MYTTNDPLSQSIGTPIGNSPPLWGGWEGSITYKLKASFLVLVSPMNNKYILLFGKIF
jgi:hypothetical protein